MYSSWITKAFGEERIRNALSESQKVLLYHVLRNCEVEVPDDLDMPEVEKLAHVLELAVYQELIEGPPDKDAFILLCQHAFLAQKAAPVPSEDLPRLRHLVKTTCFGVLGNKNTDVQTFLRNSDWLSDWNSLSWAEKVFLHCSDAFLRIVRKSGWSDLEQAILSIRELRELQKNYEEAYLDAQEASKQLTALELTALYHLARGVEILATYTSSGEPENANTLIEHHFGRALECADLGGYAELSVILTWMNSASKRLVDISLWKALTSLDPSISRYGWKISSKGRPKPILEIWPSQKQALIRDNLLDPTKRAVVVQMPTSSGKTLLAEFKIVYTKMNLPKAWIAYVAPTRTLVNQVANDLKRSLGLVGIKVVKAVPVYEIDPMEEDSLQTEHFDVLVTTPEKLDLIVRGNKIDTAEHPLGLVVFDEAQTIGAHIRNWERPLKAEMVLSVISNRFPETRFLLLTPSVPNAEDLATWLGGEESAKIQLDWKPNEQIVGLVTAEGSRRNWQLKLTPIYTSTPDVAVSGSIPLTTEAPLDLAISGVRKYHIASSVANILSRRGNLVVYTQKAIEIRRIADSLIEQLPSQDPPADIGLVSRFLEMEYGSQYKLVGYLRKGVACHHAGLTEECRMLIEWLMRKGHIKALIATTTMAYGVNLPISSLVMNSYKLGIPPAPMSSNLFWNLVGRVGRAYQDDIGLVLFVDKDETDEIAKFVDRGLAHLYSSLEGTLLGALKHFKKDDLQNWTIGYPYLSSFIQYLSHLYRQIGDHNTFLKRGEQILLSTLGYRNLRQHNPEAAQRVLDACLEFAEHMKAFDPETLPSVDQTGFSPSTVNEAAKRTAPFTISEYETPANLFHPDASYAMRIAGILRTIKELNFKEPFRIEHKPLGIMLSHWVRGNPISEIAAINPLEIADSESALHKHTQAIGRIASLGSWGMGVVVSLLRKDDDYSKLDARQVAELQTLPAMVFFGVDTLEGVAMRSLGVPRLISRALGERYREHSQQDIPRINEVEAWLQSLDIKVWDKAVPKDSILSGEDFMRIWRIFNGMD